MTRVFLGLGSNVGDRAANISDAVAGIGAVATVVAQSSVIETKPVGYIDQADFLNTVVLIETDLGVRTLLEKLQAIEQTLGKKIAFKNGPRTIDIDILTFGDEKIDEDDLHVPHPRMNERQFVLDGIAEIAKRTE